jgi:hypothetical protein
MMIKTAFGGIAEFRKWAASHCDVARLLGTRMGLSAQVQQALRHLYERWDGNGMPGDLRGTQIPLAVRLMQVAQDADVAWQYGGTALIGPDPDPVGRVGPRPGGGQDLPVPGGPSLQGPGRALHLGRRDGRRAGPATRITEARLDACLSAIADFADLKSMWTAGHSRGVADLAERAAGVAGLAATEVGRAAPRGAGARHRARRGAGQRVGEARPADPWRARAGAAACLPQRAGARRLSGAAPAGPAGRLPRRAVRRIRIPPRQPGR